MKLSEVKNTLTGQSEIIFKLPNGDKVPPHFHVTEVGSITKHFIDCGGTIRNEKVANFQLYTADDHDHRLTAQKLKSIIELSESKLGMEDSEVEVEYQGETIGKYGLAFDGEAYLLTTKQTDCLASDQCGISPSEVTKTVASSTASACCEPGSGCC